MTTIDFTTKTGPELVSLFNAIPGVKPVKRFASRADAVKRIMRTLAAAPTSVIPRVGAEIKIQPVAIAPVAATVTLGKKRGPKSSVGIYNLPKGDLIKAHRVNSERGRLILILLEGGGRTFAELLEIFPNWDAAQLHKTIRMLNWYLGYSVFTDDAGIMAKLSVSSIPTRFSASSRSNSPRFSECSGQAG